MVNKPELTAAAYCTAVTVTAMVLSLLVSVPKTAGCTVMVAVPAVTPVMVIMPLALTVAVTLELEGVTVTLLLVVPLERLTVAVTESAAPPTVTAETVLERAREETVTEAEAGVVTVKTLVKEFPPAVMVKVLSPAVAEDEMFKVAVIWVPALLTVGWETVMPAPDGKLKVAPAKFVPIIVIGTVVPARPVAGVMEITEVTMADCDAAATVKVTDTRLEVLKLGLPTLTTCML